MKWNSYTSKNVNKPSERVCYKCGNEPTIVDGWGHDLCPACYLKVKYSKPKIKRRLTWQSNK